MAGGGRRGWSWITEKNVLCFPKKSNNFPLTFVNHSLSLMLRSRSEKQIWEAILLTIVLGFFFFFYWTLLHFFVYLFGRGGERERKESWISKESNFHPGLFIQQQAFWRREEEDSTASIILMRWEEEEGCFTRLLWVEERESVSGRERETNMHPKSVKMEGEKEH